MAGRNGRVRCLEAFSNVFLSSLFKSFGRFLYAQTAASLNSKYSQRTSVLKVHVISLIFKQMWVTQVVTRNVNHPTIPIISVHAITTGKSGPLPGQVLQIFCSLKVNIKISSKPMRNPMNICKFKTILPKYRRDRSVK